jgi:predicted Zn-dependent protease with MMP-like domain
MKISKEKFEELVAEAIENLPEKFKEKLHNVAIFVENYPSKKQLKELGMRRDYDLFGLFEGYAQARRLNFGPVLPDRITIFKQPICKYCSSEQEVKKKIISTVKHEIAHHFGSDEKGAGKAGRQKP